jgi:hypothetical protein
MDRQGNEGWKNFNSGTLPPCFIIAFTLAPPVDIDGIREPVAVLYYTVATTSSYII